MLPTLQFFVSAQLAIFPPSAHLPGAGSATVERLIHASYHNDLTCTSISSHTFLML